MLPFFEKLRSGLDGETPEQARKILESETGRLETEAVMVRQSDLTINVIKQMKPEGGE